MAHAAGGLVGSANDLARWARALHGGRVVTPALYDQMVAPARLADGSTEPYGFGLRLGTLRGRRALIHGGSGRGIDTDSLYLPEGDVFVAVLANSDAPATDPGTLTRRLAALALGMPVPALPPVAVDPASLAPLFGTYGAADGPPRRFFARDGRLFVGRGDEEAEVFAAGEDRFVVGRAALNWFRIRRHADGAPVMELHRIEAAAPEQGTRIGPVPTALTVAPATLARYVGRFQTEGPVLVVALDADGRLTVGPAGQDPLPLRAVSQTEFRVGDGLMRLEFHPDGEAVDRLTLHRGARQLHGTRVK